MTIFELLYILATASRETFALNLRAACVIIALLGWFNRAVLTMQAKAG